MMALAMQRELLQAENEHLWWRWNEKVRSYLRWEYGRGETISTLFVGGARSRRPRVGSPSRPAAVQRGARVLICRIGLRLRRLATSESRGDLV